jgi:hypothetical protein
MKKKKYSTRKILLSYGTLAAALLLCASTLYSDVVVPSTADLVTLMKRSAARADKAQKRLKNKEIKANNQ